MASRTRPFRKVSAARSSIRSPASRGKRAIPRSLHFIHQFAVNSWCKPAAACGGRVVMSKTVEVVGPVSSSLVVVYRGVTRETWSCATDCQPRNTLGDGKDYFTDTLAQIGARNGAAQGGGAAGPAAAR